MPSWRRVPRAPDRPFVTDSNGSAVTRHAISADLSPVLACLHGRGCCAERSDLYVRTMVSKLNRTWPLAGERAWPRATSVVTVRRRRPGGSEASSAAHSDRMGPQPDSLAEYAEMTGSPVKGRDPATPSGPAATPAVR